MSIAGEGHGHAVGGGRIVRVGEVRGGEESVAVAQLEVAAPRPVLYQPDVVGAGSVGPDGLPFGRAVADDRLCGRRPSWTAPRSARSRRRRCAGPRRRPPALTVPRSSDPELPLSPRTSSSRSEPSAARPASAKPAALRQSPVAAVRCSKRSKSSAASTAPARSPARHAPAARGKHHHCSCTAGHCS